MKITKFKIQELENISSDKYFNHPFFGNLKLDKTKKCHNYDNIFNFITSITLMESCPLIALR